MTVSMEDLRAGRVELDDLVEPGTEALDPVHPGEILRDCLDELGMSAYALAKAIRVPVNRVTAILAGRRAITADTALRLARFFGMSPEFWLGLQMDYDLETARATLGHRLEREVTPRAA